MNDDTATRRTDAPNLRRVLTLWDLVLYGVVIISPVAPTGIFGVLNKQSHGHAATAILIAMFAMLMTAVSYGRMARAYPSAGSAFTYVGKELNPFLGYVAGWGMLLDYLIGPLINVIWCSEQSHVFVPSIPYWAWTAGFALVLTTLNVQGIVVSARVHMWLAAVLGGVVAMFFVAAALYVLQHPHEGSSFFIRPFYDASSWSAKHILEGTSLAVLTYIGFDGISTLAEEVRNPRRNVLLATVLTCVVVGLLSVLEVYAAQLAWPMSEPYPNLDTAFTAVAQRVWSPLYEVLGVTLIVAFLGSGLACHMGAARLLFGMGRSTALPSFFGSLEPKRAVPRNNVIVVGTLALTGALVFPALAGESTGYEFAANLLNFGALIAFMGVNAAAFVHYYLRADRKLLRNLVPPVIGFIVCGILWWNLRMQARVVGAVWMLIGVAFGAWRTRGFQRNQIILDIPMSHPGDFS